MEFVSCNYSNFVNQINGKKVVLFGASTGWNYYLAVLPSLLNDVLERVICIVDNNKKLQNTKLKIAGKEYEVKSPEYLKTCDNLVILITVRFRYFESICDQLISYDLPEDVTCYSLKMLCDMESDVDNSCVDAYFEKNTDICIPKKIHSFWFSGEEKPDRYKRCIESWNKYCPDYEIYEWNMQNYNVEKNEYMKQAVLKKKWAFVSDFARLDVVYTHGGIYLDMDVELMASIEHLRNAKAFFCRQNDGTVDLGSGFGAYKGHPFVKELLQEYDELSFVDSNGVSDITPQPTRLSPVFKKYGLKSSGDSDIINDILILSNDYIICPENVGFQRKIDKSLGIHWHNGGWLTDAEKEAMILDEEVREKIESYFLKR